MNAGALGRRSQPLRTILILLFDWIMNTDVEHLDNLAFYVKRVRHIDDVGKYLTDAFGDRCLIPTVIDQNPCAHLRMPRDMIFHGWSMRLFQAWQHSTTMSS